MRVKHLRAATALLLLLALPGSPALAQSARGDDPGQRALLQAQQLLQQLAGEKAALEAEKAELQKQVATLERTEVALRDGIANFEVALEESRSVSARLREQL